VTQTEPHRIHPDDPGEPSTGTRRIGIARAEAGLLAGWADGLRVCEIGTGLGISTIALYEVAAELTTIDIDPWVHRTVWPTLPASITKLRERPDKTYQLIFVDGDHRPEAVRADVDWAKDHAPIVVCHDWREVSPYLGDVSNWHTYNTQYGLGMLIR